MKNKGIFIGGIYVDQPLPHTILIRIKVDSFLKTLERLSEHVDECGFLHLAAIQLKSRKIHTHYVKIDNFVPDTSKKKEDDGDNI
jgi:hypothetical protein